jgi:dTDP-4-dehydrorhamnose 3,5-epimerase-like enzyme
MGLTQLETYAVHKDERGHLFEVFRYWEDDICEMAYTVLTNPGCGRDLDRWHYHYNKTEAFLCLYGEMCIATKDAEGIKSWKLKPGDGVRVVVPPDVRHSVVNMSSRPAVLLVLCDAYYDPEDEWREPMDDWSWDTWLKTMST